MTEDSHAMANQDQANAWDGDEGASWAANADRYDAGMRAHSQLLHDAAAVEPHESVLDIGCGNGVTTRDAARAASAGTALGIDLSSAMLTRARESAAAEGLANAEFRQADAQTYAFPAGAFDIAISRFGVMFFDDPVAAFTNVAGALKPGGRIALIVWRPLAENEWFSTIGDALALGRTSPTRPAGAPGPFGFSEPPFVQRVLTASGFTDIALKDRDAEYYVGADAEDAFAYTSTLGFTRMMLSDLDDTKRTEALAALKAAMVANDSGHGVTLGSAVWIVTAKVT